MRVPYTARVAWHAAVQWRRRQHPAAVVLMYHRVAASGVDPWRLAVTPAHFAEHLDVLRRQTQPVALQALSDALRVGRIPERATVVTFDDGYANNLHQAQPALAAAAVPATVFVATGYTNAQREFWWDELDQLLLAPTRLPGVLELTLCGQPRRWALGNAVEPDDSATARAASNALPGTRLALYYDVWDALRPLPHEERRLILDDLRRWSGITPALRETHRAMTVDELHMLGADGLVEIGAHTVTHPRLPSLNREGQRAEVLQSCRDLKRLLGRPPQSFSYPFGAMDEDSREAARDAGTRCATTIRQDSVWGTVDPWRIPRFEVQDWNGREFETRLSRWFRSRESTDYAEQ